MKLTVLRNFIAISYCGSFTKAAEQLLISQPTLSRQISDLEKELGVKLFERNHKGLFNLRLKSEVKQPLYLRNCVMFPAPQPETKLQHTGNDP